MVTFRICSVNTVANMFFSWKYLLMYSFTMSTSELVGHKMTRSHSQVGLEMLASMSSYTQWTMSFSLSPGIVSVSLSLMANSPSSGTTGILASPRSKRNWQSLLQLVDVLQLERSSCFPLDEEFQHFSIGMSSCNTFL